ncbi:TnsD family Tn7-like transposition protein [Vogesella oryzae]|uniref:TnsD family Tn7-like transposition protein n=1 Tax=Vogesella oryzae TaxID=1735285 RepID=UPI0015823F3D|nr:TnsD family Tn7-like transposition protein [Vogesella oryzae]
MLNNVSDLETPQRRLPGWLPDESLFSWASRFHWLSGNVQSVRTNRILFGHARSGSAHDLPGGLDHFVERSGGELGDVETILQWHTIAPVLLAFQPPEKIERAINQMRTSSPGMLKFLLGLVTAQFRANFPLKACPECMAHDYEEHQVAYWHRAHQLPGVWLCPVHGSVLLEAQRKANGVGRFEWVLPASAELGPPKSEDGHSIMFTASAALARLARSAVSLAENPLRQPLAAEAVVHSHTTSLIEAGYVTRTGKPRISLAVSSYLEHCAKLREIPEFVSLPATPLEAESHLRRLLSIPRFVRHPLHQMVMISWLYPSHEAFLQSCASAQMSPPAQPVLKGHKELKSSTVSAAVLDSYARGEISARKASTLFGIDIKTFMACAASHGMTSTRRPKKLKADLYQQLVLDLESGMDKSIAAERAGISPHTVTTVLRTVPGLQSLWHSKRQEAAKTQARQSWLNARQEAPELNNKALRLLQPAVFAWLYRNDREWLQTHAGPRQPGIPKVRVRWDQRDIELAHLVEQAALEIAQAFPHKRTTLQDLYKKLPLLRMRLGALARLPLTLQVIERVTKKLPQTSPPLFPEK